MRRYSIVLLSALILSSLCFAKVESIGPATAGVFPEAIVKVLEPKGYRVALPDGTVVCEIWFRAAIPPRPAGTSKARTFLKLSSSEFVGVVTFPKQVSDFRGQPIKPGSYGLRGQPIASQRRQSHGRCAEPRLPAAHAAGR